MLFAFIVLVFGELRASDANLRLPIYYAQEGTRPYQIIAFYTSDVELNPDNPDYIEVEIISRNSMSTIAKVSVKYNGTKPITTQINATAGSEIAQLPVEIDIIDHLSIVSTSEPLYVNTYMPFQVKACNKNGQIFTSLNGTHFEWGSNTNDKPFIFCKFEDTPLTRFYKALPYDQVIIKGEQNGEANLTCKLTIRDVKPAICPLRFTSPILFQPKDVYMVKGTEIDLFLYYCFGEKDQLKPSKYIDLKIDHDIFELESSSPSVATVTDDGKVTALDLGTSRITATEIDLPANKARAVVHVILPDEVKWEEQWVKSTDQNKGPDSKGPFNPNVSLIKLFYKKKSVTIPDNLKITMIRNWDEIGTHVINATFDDINISFQTVVHTCPPPKIESDNDRVSVDGRNYQFKIVGGSGHFNFEYDHSMLSIGSEQKIENESDGRISSVCSFSPLKSGKAIVTISDQKFSDYKETFKLEIFSSTPEIEVPVPKQGALNEIKLDINNPLFIISVIITVLMAILAIFILKS